MDGSRERLTVTLSISKFHIDFNFHPLVWFWPHIDKYGVWFFCFHLGGAMTNGDLLSVLKLFKGE